MGLNKIAGMTPYTTPASDDVFASVDVGDTTASTAGTTKKIEWQYIVDYVQGVWESELARFTGIGIGKDGATDKIMFANEGTIDVDGNDLNIDCGTNKTIELITTVYDDQQVVLGAVGRGVSAPTDAAFKGSEVLSFSASQDNLITFTAQFSHKMKQGTAVEFHVHDVPTTDNTGDVRWVFTISFADITGTFPTETTYPIEQTVAANGQDDHLYFEIDDDVCQSSSVSGIAVCSLMREGTHSNDTYADAILLIAIDFHIPIDTIGSRQEAVK